MNYTYQFTLWVANSQPQLFYRVITMIYLWSSLLVMKQKPKMLGKYNNQLINSPA